MSVYSQYATGASIDVAVDESYDGLVGIYRMIEESALNEHAIFEHVIACDFAEAYTNHGAMTESAFEAINEASVSEIWGKVKEFVKRMWAKILGIIQNLITKIQSVFIRDGKELVKKYEKTIVERKRSNKLTKMPVKFNKLKSDVESDIKVVENVAASALEDKIGDLEEYVKKYKAYVSGTDTSNKWEDASEKDREADEFKQFSAEDLDGLKEKALGKIIGVDSVSAKEFTKEYVDKVFEEVDKEGFTDTELTYCKGILESHKDLLKTLKDDENKAKQQAKKDIKAMEEIEKQMTQKRADTKVTYTKNAERVRMGASKMIQLYNAKSSVIATGFAGKTAVAKKAFAEARSLWVKAASYGGKAESTLLEAVEEVSNWEVEEMFAM